MKNDVRNAALKFVINDYLHGADDLNPEHVVEQMLRGILPDGVYPLNQYELENIEDVGKLIQDEANNMVLFSKIAAQIENPLSQSNQKFSVQPLLDDSELRQKALSNALSDIFSEEPSDIDEGSDFMLWYKDTTGKVEKPEDLITWELFEDYSDNWLREQIESEVAKELHTLIVDQAKNNTLNKLAGAAKCALADLQGIMPEVEPSGERKHPGWVTINELSTALDGIDPDVHPKTESGTQLTFLQKEIAKSYCGGEFAYMKTTEEMKDFGDGLFVFLINEAGDACSLDEFFRMLDSICSQIQEVSSDFDDLRCDWDNAISPEAGCTYLGNTVGFLNNNTSIQNIGKKLVAHNISNLDISPSEGEMQTICYDAQGKGSVISEKRLEVER